ncbi:MAG: hypothetical protein WBA05_15385 [Gordonia sp. (in: high G+C Gram-positive bacteria)]|uniref:hypothetical protein n=1 Tax=Gordonia sp. (in: high G+C Gram-positive bacteria) TaxID=84139 RepID=UPI003C743249
MSAKPNLSVAEIELLVEEYLDLPRGTKYAWLEEKGFTQHVFDKWRRAYLGGDLAQGLVPRKGSHTPRAVKSATRKLRELERSSAAERAAFEKQIEKMKVEIAMLHEGNIAMGKAFGLLQQMSQESK